MQENQGCFEVILYIYEEDQDRNEWVAAEKKINLFDSVCGKILRHDKQQTCCMLWDISNIGVEMYF